MNRRDYVVTDDRRPSPDLRPLTERLPLGAVVAWNGSGEDGFPRRAVVVEHGDASATLLDGADRVVLDDPTVLAGAVVLAASANAYAERVSVKARALGRSHGWCEVAEEALTELNSTPADGQRREVVRAVVTTVQHFALRPVGAGRGAAGDALVDLLRRDLGVGGAGFHGAYFRYVPDAPNGEPVRVELRLVDALPTGDPVPAEASAP